MRADLRICRSLGRTLREFLSLPPRPGEVFDWIERELWRAFDEWEADLCPGCGQPLTETTRKLEPGEAARYVVNVRYCGACKVVEAEAERLRVRDEQRNKELGRRLPSGHRRFSISLNPAHHTHDAQEVTHG